MDTPALQETILLNQVCCLDSASSWIAVPFTEIKQTQVACLELILVKPILVWHAGLGFTRSSWHGVERLIVQTAGEEATF
eukprot:4128264-Amphidinium_carterae.1